MSPSGCRFMMAAGMHCMLARTNRIASGLEVGTYHIALDSSYVVWPTVAARTTQPFAVSHLAALPVYAPGIVCSARHMLLCHVLGACHYRPRGC